MAQSPLNNKDYRNIDNKKTHVLNKFTSNVGLIEQVFGEKGIILYDLDKEKVKNILVTVYGFTDVYDVFGPELDQEKIDRTLRTMFRFNDLQLPTNIEEPSIFDDK